MEITVESGVGYIDVKDAERKEVGLIPLDCDFTPIDKISLSVGTSSKRTGNRLDAVLIGVTTDGSITPKDALLEAIKDIARICWKSNDCNGNVYRRK